MLNNSFIDYLWNKDLETRISVFGTFFAAAFFALTGFAGLSAMLMVGHLGFIFLEVHRLHTYYYLELMDRNGLDTEKIESFDEVYRLAEDN